MLKGLIVPIAEVGLNHLVKMKGALRTVAQIDAHALLDITCWGGLDRLEKAFYCHTRYNGEPLERNKMVFKKENITQSGQKSIYRKV